MIWRRAEGLAWEPSLSPRPCDRLGGVVAIAMLLVWAAQGALEARRLDEPAVPAAGANASGPLPVSVPSGPELMVGAYGGRHFTYASDVRFSRPDAVPSRDFTVEDVAWEGQSFKHPLYYGVRVTRWAEAGEGGGRFGGMLDFIHSKAIASMAQEVRLKGQLDGKPVPDKARIADLFSKLEFSHGHNMLLLSGLMRLQSLAPRVSPYVGLGAGISLPHTELHIKQQDPRRTYEYQYAGPAAQVLAGIELRLPHLSVFLEYKFTVARYSAPLSGREGTLLPLDLWAQLQRWLSGGRPPGGYADTLLAGHQLVGGFGVRIGGAAAGRR